jgi:rfaE bifunctional protein kinase chain/domain
MKNKKIFELDSLAQKIKNLKKIKPNSKIVLCHGVFDVVHIGHIRYFKEAKRKGDFLVVSVTADNYVNKGLNRPYFKHQLRLEFLSSIKEIDAICLSNNPSSIHVIDKIKPDFYMKGNEYSKLKLDLTKKIYLEKKAVNKNGGELIFSKNIVFSSSNIINKFLDVPKNINQKYIKKINNDKLTNELINNINKISNLKILVIGETIIDRYILSEPLGKPGKDTHIVIRNKSEKNYVGGAAAVAKNVSSFGADISFLSCLGEKNEYKKLVESHLGKKVKKFFINKKNSPTIIKKRFIDEINNHKLFGEYFLNDNQISKKDENKILSFLNKKKYDLVILLDYGHGLITKKIIQKLKKTTKFLAINAQINSSNIGYHSIQKFSSSDLLIINESELRHEARDKETNIEIVSKNFAKKNNFKTIIVTMGSKGSLLVNKKLKILKCPAFENKEVVDKVGAGDTMLSVIAPLFYLKNNDLTSILCGNLAGAISIRNLANSKSLNKVKLINYYKTILK